MTGRVVILRPRPAAEATAERARAMGLTPVVAPLFTLRPLAWQAPDAAAFDAVMLTSANAVRFAGEAMTPFLGLPCYAVGEATAAAAGSAGFGDVRIGPTDGEALAGMMAAAGLRSAFHPCGRHRTAFADAGVRVVHVPVYEAEPAGRLPAEAEAALADGAVVLLHSPRAAATFGRLAQARRGQARIAAISPAAAAAAGPGWLAVAVAEAPRDPALLEVAAKLCQSAGA